MSLLHRSCQYLALLFIFSAFAGGTAGCKREAGTGKDEGEKKLFPGYTLIEQLGIRATDLVDASGTPVHRWKSERLSMGNAELQKNGELLRSEVLRNSPFTALYTPGLGGRIERLDWDGSVLWTFEYATKETTLHHDFKVLPNGNILALAIEIKHRDALLEAGRDPALIRMNEIWFDSVLEIKPSGSNGGDIVWEWHLWDHLVQDFDPKRKNTAVVAGHPELVDINFIQNPEAMSASTLRKLQSIGYVNGQTPANGSDALIPDWTHSNAISYHPELDQILLTSRNVGEVWIIDHSTTTEEAAGHKGGKSGRGGDLLYRWGNPQSYQAGRPSDQVLFGPHDGHWIPEGVPGAGNILIFNNGEGRREAYSTVEEIRPPLQPDGSYTYLPGKPYAPPEPVWRYTGEPKTSFYSEFLSSAQRLPNGNTLICFGMQNEIFEVAANNKTLGGFKIKTTGPSAGAASAGAGPGGPVPGFGGPGMGPGGPGPGGPGPGFGGPGAGPGGPGPGFGGPGMGPGGSGPGGPGFGGPGGPGSGPGGPGMGPGGSGPGGPGFGGPGGPGPGFGGPGMGPGGSGPGGPGPGFGGPGMGPGGSGPGGPGPGSGGPGAGPGRPGFAGDSQQSFRPGFDPAGSDRPPGGGPPGGGPPIGGAPGGGMPGPGDPGSNTASPLGIFRAERFPLDFPAFKGRKLEPLP